MNTHNPQYVTAKKAAQLLGVSDTWLAHDRIGKRRLPFIKIGGVVRYDLNRLHETVAGFTQAGVGK